ncbi:hypothetical protein BOX15_Mlig001809g8 [Macrostomum lignano]|uniref:Uncharacterized protein n=2 Tax=Macrostomum lignano TaxID=282301 RepID=A0A267FS80_9PLAT|nr:hypothetical protein BOX15_Mlig001809g8 [Macrostomum lignano]
MMKLFSKNKSKDSTGTAPASSSSKESNGCYNIKEKSLDKIYRAAWNGDIKKLNTFQNDVNVPDSEKRTALHLACANGQERAVDVLLSMGADATVVDKENRTPLYRAVQTNRALCIRVLLKKVPNLAKDESSISLLHMAVQNGSSESLAALLSSMSDAVDTTDSNGRTALMLACESGRTSMVAALLDKGASLAATDAAGRSCSDYAKPHPDCLKIIESRRSGRPSVSNPNTPRGNRTSSDFEEDESKSTDFDIPVNTRVAGRSRSPVVALVGGRRAISLNVLPPGESSVQVFDPETEKSRSLKVPIVRDKRKRSRSQSPAVSPTASIESLGSDDEAARLAAGSVAGEANKSSARAEAPPMRKSLAAVPEAATATTKNSAAMTPPAPSQPAAAASVGGGGGNESDSDWSNSQSASAAAPETGGKSLGAKINLKLELEKRMAGTAAAAGSVGSAKNNIADDVEDIVEIGDAEDDDDDNTVASEFPPTTAPTPRSVGNAATPRDGFQRQDSDWEASEISEAPPPQPKLKRESTEQVTAAKADDEESDWDESVAVSAAAKGPDEVKAQPASAKLSAAPEDESDWDNSMTEAPSIAAAAAVPQPSNSKPLPATVNLGESANSVARDEISEWDSATEDVPSSAATEAPSPRTQQQEQPPDSARNQGSLQPIAEEAAVVAAAIAADLNQPPAAAVSVDVAKKADGLEFWDSEASLAASDGPPSNRSEPSAASGVEKPLAAAAKDKLETQAQGDTDTDEDIDFARDGGGNVTIKFAGRNETTEDDGVQEIGTSASPQEAGEKLNADDEESPKRSIEEFPAAAADAAASATGTLSRKPSSPRAPSPKPMTSSVAVATSACPSPVREDPEALARLQAELATAVDNLAESRAESARLSEELELATNKLSEARRLQADAEAELATARRRLEAEQAESARLAERLRADAASAEELARVDLRREREVSAEASLALEAARSEVAELKRKLELEREEGERIKAEMSIRAAAVAEANGDAASPASAAAASEALADLRERLAETRAELATARAAQVETSAAAEAATGAARADGERAGRAESARRIAAQLTEALAESAEVGESASALRIRIRKLLGLPDVDFDIQEASRQQQQQQQQHRSSPVEVLVSTSQNSAPAPAAASERTGLTLEFRSNGFDSADGPEAVTFESVRMMDAEQLRQACLQLSSTCEHLKQSHDQERRLRRKLTEELQRVSNAEAHTAAALSLEKERARAVASSRAFLTDAQLTGYIGGEQSRLPQPPPPQQPRLPHQQQQQQLDAFLLEELRAELNCSISKHLESEDTARRNLISSRAKSTTRLSESPGVTAGESDFSYLTYLKRKYLV